MRQIAHQNDPQSHQWRSPMRKLEKKDGKYVILYSQTNAIHSMIHIRLTHSPCRTSHAPPRTTATWEKNRAPITEKTQKVSQTRSPLLQSSPSSFQHNRSRLPLLWHGHPPKWDRQIAREDWKQCFNVSFVKGHLTGRKLTTTQCRYYVDQEVKWTPCHKTYDHLINPTHKNHQKAGKKDGKYVIIYSQTNVWLHENIYIHS